MMKRSGTCLSFFIASLLIYNCKPTEKPMPNIEKSEKIEATYDEINEGVIPDFLCLKMVST